MSTEVKYHIGANGPRRCHAEKRACRYAGDPHGGKEEMQQVWEAKQETEFADSMLTGVSKDGLKSEAAAANRAADSDADKRDSKLSTAEDGLLKGEEAASESQDSEEKGEGAAEVEAVEGRYHLTDNGPRKCNANKRRCRYEDELHGSEEGVKAMWKRKRNGEEPVLPKAEPEDSAEAKSSESEAEVESKELDPKTRSKLAAEKTLGTRAKYSPDDFAVSYSESEKDTAMKLALGNLTELSYTPVKRIDSDWETDGFSSVQRYELEDGSIGYFKAFSRNSHEEWIFRDYGTSSLEASINEVNAHRMAKLLGDEYSEMVPETVIREIDGRIGTLQREVEVNERIGTNFNASPELKQDYRRAALFDFLVGNADRHSGNYMLGEEDHPDHGPRNRIRLIDNSFTFPRKSSIPYINESCFATNSPPGGYFDRNGYNIPEHELAVTEAEKDSVRRAKAGIETWAKNGTISQDQADSFYSRADELLKDGAQLGEYDDYIYKLKSERWS